MHVVQIPTFSFLDIKRERLRPYCIVIHNELWVTLSSPSPPIPHEAQLYKDLSPASYPLQRCPFTGRFQRMEWGSSPDWYRRETHWRAWIPLPKPASWFDIRIGGACDGQWEAVGDKIAFAADFKISVVRDLVDANAILRRLHQRLKEDSQWRAPGVLLPPPPHPGVLDGSFDNLLIMAQRLADVQRHFLELLGGLRWLMNIDDDLAANMSFVACDLQLDVEQRLIEWDLPQCYGRGVLIDLLRDWREINISLYVDDGIPVHYMWTPALQGDPRFRSLSPMVLDIPCMNDSVAWAYGSAAAPITTHLADQFLQLRYPLDTPVVKRQTRSKMCNFVVDFEGWKARDITNSQRQCYLTDLWYVEVPGTSSSQRVFYRNRPRIDYYDKYNYLNAPAEENLNIIREMWKFSCCPPPFYRYSPPLAIEQEVVGESTIPRDMPISSLQPVPPPPSSGDPYLDDEDSDDSVMEDVRTISMTSRRQTYSISSLSTVDTSTLPHYTPITLTPPVLSGEHVDLSTPRLQQSASSSSHGVSDASTRPQSSSRPPAVHQSSGNTRQCSASFSDDRYMGHQRPDLLTGWKGKTMRAGRSESFRSLVSEHADNRWGIRANLQSQDRLPHQTDDGWGRSLSVRNNQNNGCTDLWEQAVRSGRGVPTDESVKTGRAANRDHFVRDNISWGASPAHDTTTKWIQMPCDDNTSWGPPGNVYKDSCWDHFSGWDQVQGGGNNGREPPVDVHTDIGWNQAMCESTTGRALAASQPAARSLSLSITDLSGSKYIKSANSGDGGGDCSGTGFDQPASATQLVDDAAVREDQQSDHAGMLMSSALPPMQHINQICSTLHSLVSPFVVEVSAVPVLACNWNQRYISVALVSVTRHDEARLRYRALRHSNWTILDLLTDALHRGIPLQLAVPIKNAASFLPSKRVGKPHYYNLGYQDPPLVWAGCRKALAKEWLDRCREVFSRAHARGYLFMGGLLWRLALKFGGHAIMEAATNGPSVAATAFGRRDECLEGFAFVDAPSKHEEALVLGAVSLGTGLRSLWPSEEIFRGLSCWSGEWNAECEHWFESRWNAICSPDGAMPMRKGDWKRHQRWGRRDRKDCQEPLQKAFDIFTGATEKRWNGRRAVDISLPEVI